MFLTGRAALFLGLGVIPLVFFSASGINAWLVFGVWLLLWVLAIVLDILASAPPRTIEISRSIPSRARLGEWVETSLALRNTGSRLARLRVRDAWQPTAGAPEERPRIDIPAGERRHVSVPLRPRRRGELTSEFVTLRSLGPIGFAGRQHSEAVRGAIRVLPPFTSRRHLPSRLARLKELDGNTSLQVRGQGTEFDSLREYVRGDDVRSIDWRATARAGTTMLRTWRPERDRHVVILIDTGRTSAARVGDGTRLDASMEAALLLSALAERAGDHVHLVMYDRRVRARVSGVSGPALLPALVDAMAPVDAQLIDTDWDAAFAQIRTVTTRPALVVVLTAQDSPASARAFLGSLPAPRRGTTWLVATASDTGLIDIAADRVNAAAVYRAAAAEKSLAEMRDVADAIVRAGFDTVTGSPEDLPPRVADRYLELKATGRL